MRPEEICNENERLKHTRLCQVCKDKGGNNLFLPCTQLVLCAPRPWLNVPNVTLKSAELYLFILAEYVIIYSLVRLVPELYPEEILEKRQILSDLQGQGDESCVFTLWSLVKLLWSSTLPKCPHCAMCPVVSGRTQEWFSSDADLGVTKGCRHPSKLMLFGSQLRTISKYLVLLCFSRYFVS